MNELFAFIDTMSTHEVLIFVVRLRLLLLAKQLRGTDL